MITPAPRALVTGASGFIGGEVLRAARERGWTVVGVGRAKEGEPPAMRTLDLTAPPAVDALIDEVDPEVVFHLAASRGRRAGDAAEVLETEERMLGNLARALTRSRSSGRLVVMGSAAEYGDPQRESIQEDTPLVPVTPYGRAKARLEQAAFDSDVPVIWLRSFNVMGPGQPRGHPVADWTWQAVECERRGGGTLRTERLDLVRDFLDVRDVADAVLAAVALDPPAAVNVCSGVATELREVVKRLIELVEAPIQIASDAASGEAPPARVVGDPGRLRSLTGWSARISLEQSLHAGIEWVRTQTLASTR